MLIAAVIAAILVPEYGNSISIPFKVPEAVVIDESFQPLDDLAFQNEMRRQRAGEACRHVPALDFSASKRTNVTIMPNVDAGNQEAVVKSMPWRQLFKDLELNVSFPATNIAPRWWRSHIHVNEKHKIVYCHTPKVASRNLLRYLIKLSDPTLSDDYVASLQVHTNKTGLDHITNLAKYRPGRVSRIMKRYAKVVFSRNPLDRLLSAWYDKLYVYNAVFARRHGQRIIRTYRLNATEEEIEHGSPVHLDEFMRYIAETTLPTRFFDPHWKPQHEVCFLCAIKYDFMGRLESIDDDLAYFTKSVLLKSEKFDDIDGIPQLATARPPIPRERDVRYDELRRLPRELVERVLAKYKLDYDIFGYDMKADLNFLYGYYPNDDVEHVKSNNKVTSARRV